MVADLIENGLRQHRAGHLDDARRSYEQALGIEPCHPDGLHLLGLINLQTGHPERAVGLLEQATEVRPGNPAFHADLAQAYLASNRIPDARNAFERAARLDPHNPQFAVGGAVCLAMEGRLPEAEQQLLKVALAYPDYPLAWLNLGDVLRAMRRLQEAAELYRRALRLDPALADAYCKLGCILHEEDRFDDAEEAYRGHLALQPHSAEPYFNLASLLIDRGRAAEAAALCRQGIERLHGSAGTAELQCMLGTALAQEGRFTPALDAFRAAATMAPGNARAVMGYGVSLLRTGNVQEGLLWLERAQTLKSYSPSLDLLVAEVHLSLGNFLPGWQKYLSRPARRLLVEKFPQIERFPGTPGDLSGKRILLLGEQGLGDELFFLRFAAALKSCGAIITYCANAKIASIVERVPALDLVISQTDPMPAADAVLLIGDLPHALGAFDVSPPLAIAPLPEQLESMKQRLAALGPPPYLGLTWRAGTAPEQQRGMDWILHKRIPLEDLGTAIRGLNGTFIALQRHPEAGEIERLAELSGKPVHDLTALNEDLEAMLALLALLDDYVGVSNTNMHLRAGTGRTGKVLVPQPPEWRWMAAGDESPWFPGFRIYRQHPGGAWNDAVEKVQRDLCRTWKPAA